MFITIPLILIAVAVLALVVVVWRKWGYLRKLEPESHPVGRTFFHDLAPEAAAGLRSFHWKNYWHNILTAIEAVLGRVQAFFSSINRASERLAHSVRRVSKDAEKERQDRTEPPAPAAAQEPAKPAVDDQAERERALKEEEQQLIVAIAQDARNVVLYRRLSDVYLKLGNLKDAVESLKVAVKLEPDDGRLSERLASLKERLEKRQEREKEEERKEREGDGAGN
ncbi:MAG TPA: hypothetical protein VD862_01880 [Candidatus Paceibacterota bacterium]|nr:hypothetical protein [Candidatus Paceibacterota bacterium]